MAEQKRDYYEVLGIDKSASEKELKSAYRKLARNITLMQIRATSNQRKSSKSFQKPTIYSRTLKKESCTTNSVMRHLMRA